MKKKLILFLVFCLFSFFSCHSYKGVNSFPEWEGGFCSGRFGLSDERFMWIEEQIRMKKYLGKKITKEDKAELRRRFKEEMEVNEAEMARLKEACKKGIMFNFSSSSYLAFVKRLKGEIVTELKKEFKVAPDKEEAFKRLYSKYI